MAKTQIKNYQFKPGLGELDNLYPNAYELLSKNRTFITKATTAFISERTNAANEYSVSSAQFDPTNSELELNLGTHNLVAGDAVTFGDIPSAFTPNLVGVDLSKAYVIISATESAIIVKIPEQVNQSYTYSDPGGNLVFDAFFNYQNDSVAKCERDVGYVIDAYLDCLRYGGNESLINVIKYYWDQDVAQVDGSRGAEISAHNFIGRLINNYIFTNVEFNDFLVLEDQFIDSNIVVENLTYTPTDAKYAPTTGQLVLTLGTHNLEIGSQFIIQPSGIVFTCALDGNTTTHPYPRATGVPNIKGHDPFYNVAVKVIETTNTTVTVNVGISSDTSLHTFNSAIANAIDARPSAIISSLVDATTNVIANGLSHIPTKVKTGKGYVKFIGNYSIDDMLLITNSTKNEIIFSFNNPLTGGKLESYKNIKTPDEDFNSYIQTTDTVSTLYFNYDTRNHLAEDDIQIFVEKTENGKSVVTTRPFDFGTDAIERMRVAPALSMLDADFEYGLQPTKWAAIGTLRGYPSVYEVPGTDTPVVRVTTDASAGTDGIGQSLITVRTAGPHGFAIGTPITIKALEDSVVGANRAEGSFVITNVLDNFNFQFFAKAKVGTNDGDVISTTYTQLREAGFYTGASISSSPEFSIASNGANGTITAQLDIQSGSTIIPYDGPSPEIGAPLAHSVTRDGTPVSALPEGTQITGVIDTSAGGGTYITPTVANDYPIGTNSFDVDDSTGIVPNLALDRGDGTAVYVQSIVGNTISLTGPLTQSIIGNTATYTNIQGNLVSQTGNNLELTISRASGIYTIDAITSAGTGYVIGDRLVIPGENLEGTSPTNTLSLIVENVDEFGGVTVISVFAGTAVDGTGTFNGLTPTVSGNQGINSYFDIEYSDGVYTSVTLNESAFVSSGFAADDRIKIDGASVTPNGLTIVNDLIITVSSVDGTGKILTFNFTGTAPVAQEEYIITNTTTSGVGDSAEFIVTRTGTVYSAVINAGESGSNYVVTDTITILGSLVGGADTTNDVTITVDAVEPNGAITAFTVAGTAVDLGVNENVEATRLEGIGATFDISYATGTYTVNLVNGGADYGENQDFIILGNTLGGSTPENDLTISITTVDASGTITAVTSTGTPVSPTNTYTAVLPSNDLLIGNELSFDITRDNGTYTTIAINSPGSDYLEGNRILIQGNQLGGSTPENDILVSISSVQPDGSVVTYTPTFTSAATGDNIDLISTVLISEATTESILLDEPMDYVALATLEISFPSAHGLIPGNTFIVSVGSDNGLNGHKFAAGSFFVTEVPTLTTLRYQARTAGAIDVSGGEIGGTIYPRPDSFFIHRPYDGGVQLGTGGPQHGAQAIRQSKKYIRYQSGKGIMYTTGALFAPSYDLRSVTADGVEVGSLITVVTDDNDHGLQVGGIVRLLGIETPGYNSGSETAVPPEFDYEVVDVVDERTFKIRSQRRLGSTDAILGFGSQVSVVEWHGATVRSGIFDDQNGIFWEYDGTNLSVNQRTGTRQISGTIAMQKDNNIITGTNTKFRDQLKAGDRIIIKGMTHVVSHVNSQTEMTVTPDWRGVRDITGTKANLIVDKKVKQKDFNLDTLDGNGPSGYDLDIAKMQMIGIQYSWYGAGFIDFMLRGADGNFVFAHRMRNSNVNTEAFMRSGNLPVRYEVTNEGPSGKLAIDINDSVTTLQLVDSSFFPESGTLYIDNEIITFNGKNDSTNQLLNLTRGATFINFQAGADRSYTAGAAAPHSARTGVILISQTITPLISHWGSAFITDGGFDEDRGYIFSYNASNINVTSIKETAFLIRLAPSVSNAIVGDLGDRELLNRAQLLLQSLEVTSDGVDGTNNPITGGIVVEGVLNPKNYPTNPSDVNWSGLSSQAQGGQPSFAQVASAGGITWTTSSSATTSVTVSPDLDTGFVYTRTDFTNEEGQNTWTMDRDPFITNGSPYNEFQGYVEVFTQNPTSMNPWYLYGLTFNNNDVQVNAISRFGEQNLNGNARLGPDATMKFVFPGNRNFEADYALVTEATYNSSGVTIGSRIDESDTNWPPNTQVSDIVRIDHGNQTAYILFFNNTSLAPINPGDTVTFFAGQASFAEPGETVFSFIATPGERATVDFSALKELTNTPLGGRGTYPNGPDVLAINVYKSGGANTTANIIVNWGEAQA